MIKFFRKIRQNLLMENKTGKYLKYAIGEIVLVVIGILIALQINNWNENKKSHAFETKLLQELETSLDRDLGRTKSLLNGRALVKSKAIDDLLNDLQEDNIVEDSILISNFFKAGITLSFSYDKGPYESLKSGGLDKIKNDSLRSGIVRFYEVTMPMANIFLDYKREIQNNKRELFRERIFEKYYVKEDGKWMIKNRMNFNKAKNSKDFMELIFMERRVANNYVGRLEQIVNQLVTMRQSLSEELDSR